ncbi:hypothetical protein [Sphingomonas sp. Leaf208]|jgi:hypothetical protein|uniref:hypothetical protein n=1 Tax=Sphingomonas sp. Leaf208 TaxID=1735679 RepID=UPI0009EB8EEA|nr:hypothetical protein [Sphingomonas sp. Leaf208]
MMQDAAVRAMGRWWETRWFALALVLASAVPLLWPALPPLGDLPGHMGRWHIAMALPTSPDLQRYYAYHWALIPNLGMDLLVPALSHLFPFEVATKLAVIAIPMLTATGLLWAAREAHGRIPPTAMFALPLAYAWPFQFGFVNFALSQALAFCALALWIRLGRQDRLIVRALLFVPIACVIWISHSFGWGLLGLMAAGADIARLRTAGRGWPAALVGAAIQCLSMTVPLLVMLASIGAGTGAAAGGLGGEGWFDAPVKLVWLVSLFRDHWPWFDLLSLLPLIAMLYAGMRSARLGFSPLLGIPALLCLAAFVVLPRLLMGGAYVDMRMAPAAVMLGLIAIAPRDSRMARTLAVMATAFLVLRLAGTTLSFVERSSDQQRELAAVAAIPHGAAVLSLVELPCGGAWDDARRNHLPALAIVRRDVFTNDQWAIEGQQSLHIRYAIAAPYTGDPTQSVFPSICSTVGSNFAKAIARFPRAAFTHVWTIGFPPGAAKAADLRVIWTDGQSTLYRVAR